MARDHANERSDWRIGPLWMVIVRWIAPALLLALIAWILSEFVMKRPRFDPDTMTGVADWLNAARPWLIEAAGHLLFAGLPLVLMVALRGRADRDRAEDERHHGPSWPIVALPYGAAVAGVVFGLFRELPPEPVAGTPGTPGFEAQQLDTAAYVMIALIVLLIVGGLLWCFWQALRAAGRDDVIYAEGDSPADHEA